MKVNTLLYLSIAMLLGLLSCNHHQSNKQSDKVRTVLSHEKKDSRKPEELNDCDEFMDQYEEWMNDYVKLLEKYIKKPMDVDLSSEYLKATQESTKWITQWNSKLYYCASQEKYQKRFDEISEKAEKKLIELGIE